MTERIDLLVPNPFLDGPADYLVKTIAEKLKAVAQFKTLFGDFIDPYKRMDYPLRALPALRIYNNGFTKTAESWFIDGDVVLDVIFPANIRRDQLQALQDVVSSALLQQFRRTPFFDQVTNAVPGLNELGKVFEVDKALGFEWGEAIVPLTQITVNFRLDLRQWDLYLESDERTKEAPFERTLKTLERLVGSIDGLRDDQTTEISVPVDQNLGG